MTDQSVRMGGHAQQDILETIKRRDVNECAALDERVQQGRALGAFEAAGKEPVLPADRDTRS